MNKATYGSVPFNEQIEFYKRKIPTPTATWTDIYNVEHDYAAVVAGANRREIIEDFANAIQDFIANGKTLEDFRKDFERNIKLSISGIKAMFRCCGRRIHPIGTAQSAAKLIK